MDQLRALLEAVKASDAARGRFRGLLHLLLGRTVRGPDGTVVSAGMTWRELAALLKRARWDRDAVAELGLTVRELPPRDREKFWYAAITRAAVASAEASADADALAADLAALGFAVGPAPGGKEGA